MSIINPATGSVLTGVSGGPSSLDGRALPEGFQGGLGFLSTTDIVGGQRCDAAGCRLEQWTGRATLELVAGPRAVWAFVANGRGQWAADVTRDGVRGCEDWRGRVWPGFTPAAIDENGLLAITAQQAASDFAFYRPIDPPDVAWQTLATGVRRGATMRHGRFAYSEDGAGWRVFTITPDGLVDESHLWLRCIPPSGGGAPKFCFLDGEWFVQSWSDARAALVLYRRDDGPQTAIALTAPGELAFWPDLAAHNGQALSSGCANDRDQPGDVTLWRVDPSLRAGTRELIGTTIARSLQFEFIDATAPGQPPTPQPTADIAALIARVDALEASDRAKASVIAELTQQLVEIAGAQTAEAARLDSLERDNAVVAPAVLESLKSGPLVEQLRGFHGLRASVTELLKSTYRTVWSYRDGFVTTRVPPKP